MTTTVSRPVVAKRPFLVLCLAMFLGCSSHWVLTPTIPLYVHNLGGSAFTAGLVLLAFAVPSFTIRPLLGSIADRWSAAGVLAIGLALLATGTLLLFVPRRFLQPGNDASCRQLFIDALKPGRTRTSRRHGHAPRRAPA